MQNKHRELISLCITKGVIQMLGKHIKEAVMIEETIGRLEENLSKLEGIKSALNDYLKHENRLEITVSYGNKEYSLDSQTYDLHYLVYGKFGEAILSEIKRLNKELEELI